ncbi:MAG: hypothetical protein HKP16_01980 [Xanthomonadales bacterium]|nr:hypothetical protein [Xanthomonadales bacterium]
MTTPANIYRIPPPQAPQEDPLNLRSLPLVDPPEDGWPAVEAALIQQKQRRSRIRTAGFALAATVVLALAAGLYLRPAGEPAASGAPELAVRTAPQQESGPGDTLDSLIAISQQLEGRVRLYRSEVGGMPSNDLVYQVELEDLIAQVDGELMMNPDSVGLWNQRVVLLTDLSRLYENRLRRDYRQMASL